MVEPNVFSIGVGFFPPYMQKIHHFTYTEHKAPDSGEVHKEIYKVLGGTCFMSPFRHLECVGAPRFLEN
jgi:hypothetical protein